MKIEQIVELLRELKLKRISEIIDEVLTIAQKEKWSRQRLIKTLFEEELSYRKDRALISRIKAACLPEEWSLETFPFHRQPGVDKEQIYDLAELDIIKKGVNVVFIGPPGVGKTGLASSLLLKALLNGHTGLLKRTQDLLDDLHKSIADRKTKSMLNRLSRLDVLVADEMGYLTLEEEHRNLLFKLMDNRYAAKKSTFITTNLGYDDWGQFLKNQPMVSALKSRLKQRCVTVTIIGPDLRSPSE